MRRLFLGQALRAVATGSGGMALVDGDAVAILDPLDIPRVDQESAIGEHRVAARQLQRWHRTGAQCQRQILGQALCRETELLDEPTCVVEDRKSDEGGKKGA